MILLRINIVVRAIIIFHTIYASAVEHNTKENINSIRIPIAIRPPSVPNDEEENRPYNKEQYVYGMPEDQYLDWLAKNPPKLLSPEQSNVIHNISEKYNIPLDESYDLCMTILTAFIKGSKKPAAKKRKVHDKHSTTLPQKTIKKNKKM